MRELADLLVLRIVADRAANQLHRRAIVEVVAHERDATRINAELVPEHLDERLEVAARGAKQGSQRVKPGPAVDCVTLDVERVDHLGSLALGLLDRVEEHRRSRDIICFRGVERVR